MFPGDDVLRHLLTSTRTIAVVGLSDKPERDSNEVARYLQSVGYRVIPVNPLLSEVLGERVYPSLEAIPPEVKIDLVDIFRRSEEVPAIVDQAIARHVPAVWMQQGIRNADAAARAREHGLAAIEDLCIRTTHRRLRIPSVAGP